jgi:hypothetical protein
MAHFVELDIFKKVIRGVVVDDKDTQDKKGSEVESIGAKYLHDGFGGTWVKTSYNTSANVHKLGGTPFRKNFAGIGYTYDDTRDAFIPPKSYASWTLSESTCQWEAPVAEPDDGKVYGWNEDTMSWVATN